MRGRALLPLTVLLTLAVCMLPGCAAEEEAAPPLEATPVPTMDEQTAATIYLAGYRTVAMEDGTSQVVVASGLENVGVNTFVLLEGGGEGVPPEAVGSYRWTLERPAGSAAELDDPSARSPILVPDVTGHYTLGLSIANSEGVAGRPAQLTIHAANWVGNGAVAGAPEHYADYQCLECHPGNIQTWRGTRHAATLKRAMDGEASPYYLENCIHCHTVGKNELADNDGFDDVARELGWRYPEELRPGNYAALVADYPELANLGNSQCEACHGPGSGHQEGDGNIAVSLRPELCIQCHDFLQQDRHAQWERSGHSDTSLPQVFPDGIDDPLCSSCHTTRGFIAAADGAEFDVGGREQLTCQGCHDPHAAAGENYYQVRYFGSIQLPDGTTIMNAGSSALCIYCHNVRVTPEAVDLGPMDFPPQSAAPEMLAGVGGYTYGKTLENSSHVEAIRWYGACVMCHMASSTSEDTGSADDFLSATMNEPVGEHTFLVRWDNGTPNDPSDDYENMAACKECHRDASRINGPADADYDGDGKVQGVQDEVQGLLDLVRAELLARGVDWSDQAPYWGPGRSLDQRAAIYNWSYVNNDGSRGIHNMARAVGLLQLTYRRLAGREVPGAVLRAGNPPARTLQDRFAAERPVWKSLTWAHVAIPLAVLALLAAIAAIVYRGVLAAEGSAGHRLPGGAGDRTKEERQT